jgi:hypothetical protein
MSPSISVTSFAIPRSRNRHNVSVLRRASIPKTRVPFESSNLAK